MIGATATDFVSISNMGDADYYSFTVSQPSLLDATLTPRGGVFTQAPEGQTPTSFDANARNNLSLTVYSISGTSILAAASANPAGAIESLADLTLPAAGTYYARIAASDDTIQLYELSLSVTALLPGDYNFNGVVDAADYTVWRNSLGQSGTGLAADGNSDQMISLLDYDVWKAYFGDVSTGNGAGSGSAGASPSLVPESSRAISLFVAAVIVLGRCARNGRSRG